MTNKPARERDVVERPRDVFFATIKRWKQSGESHEMLARLISEDHHRLRELEAPSPQPDTDVVERVARALDPVLHEYSLAVCRGTPFDLRMRLATAALNASTPEIQRLREALNWAETYDPQMVAQIRDRAALKQDDENHDR